MRKRTIITVLLALLSCTQIIAAPDPAPVRDILTLRSFGAIGDGRADDRAAIEEALNRAQGAPVDGEGLTYAVRGNIDATTNVDFRNATLMQTMDAPDTRRFLRESGTQSVKPAEAMLKTVKGLPVLRPDGMATYSDSLVPSAGDLPDLMARIALRTLVVRGTAETPVTVRLENIRIDRGQHPDSGGRTDGAGIQVIHASPVQVRDVEITGDGKGTALMIAQCTQVRLERVHIHDMKWAPYAGDDVLSRLTAAEVRDDFGWNNFPIYEFRSAMKRFVRVRIQEQMVGIFINLCQDVEILDSRIERLQTKIADQSYPLQSDGITIGQTKNIVIRNCHMAKCWEGIDFTGRSGEGFLFEKCTVADTIGWAFKLAHPKRNGRIVDCTAIRGGIAGFLVGAESENVELLRCRAVETAGNGYWNASDGQRLMVMSGFRIQGNPDQPTPRNIRIQQCSAINKTHPGAIDYGLLCEAPAASRGITLVDFSAVGAKIAAVKGIEVARKN